MIGRALRDQAIQFVAELCEPVGPFTFAGYGGRIARLRHEIQQASGDDLVAGAIKADARVREIMHAWADSAPLPATIAVLLDLVAAPPPAATRAPQAWQSELLELLYLCGRRDRRALASELAARADNPGSFTAELHTWFADDDSPHGKADDRSS